MKFRSELDKCRFLLEMSLTTDNLQEWEPDEEIVELFFKRRRELVSKLKDFRKSQITKGQWRKNRYKIMKGIKSFHSSTKGKQYHRAMGRFLANRDSKFTNSPFLHNEALKALSSLETHLYIELDYYLPSVSEDMNRDLLLEEVIPTIGRVKKSILGSKNISDCDLEMLIRVTEESMIILSLANRFCVDKEIAEEKWNIALKDVLDTGLLEDDDGFYLQVLNKTKEYLSELE